MRRGPGTKLALFRNFDFGLARRRHRLKRTPLPPLDVSRQVSMAAPPRPFSRRLCEASRAADWDAITSFQRRPAVFACVLQATPDHYY
jgi:hypothetical protein